MGWYATKLIMRCVVGESETPATAFEQVHVIRAADPERAFERALELGKEEEREYSNRSGEVVRWLFCGLSDLHAIESEALTDGIEVSSRKIEPSHVGDLVTEKDSLSVFWYERNKARTVGQIIEE